MRAATGFLMALLTIACASKRERRQSVYTDARTAVHAYRDTSWYHRQGGAYTVQLVEMEAWRDDIAAPTADGGATRTPAKTYRRKRSITWHAGSHTVTSAGASRSDSLYTAAAESRHMTSERKSTGPFGPIGIAVSVIVLAGLAYGLFRRLSR